MNKEELKIVFLGNPEFARFHLQALLEAGFRVVAVVSAPDKPAGRGMKLSATPVTKYARERGIPVLQPSNLKSLDFQTALRSYHAALQVVIAFRMLPEAVWNMPPMGTINLHASLLPQYRGAAPINWAIMNGETETGVSTFKLQHEIDTGPLLMQRSCSISPDDTAGSLHDKLMVLGAQTTVDTLEALLTGELEEIPQSTPDKLRTAPKLFSKECKIDFDSSVQEVHNHIRGLSPYPVAFTKLGDLRFRIYGSSMEVTRHNQATGSVLTDWKTYYKVACTNGYIHFTDVQLAGKKRMQIKELLRGLHPTPDTKNS